MFLLLFGIQCLNAQEQKASLFDNVVQKLETKFVDKTFREEKLPRIVERYRAKADVATTLNDQRQVVNDLLSNIPATHMGLLSETTFDRLIGELSGKKQPTFGFELINYDGKYFAHNVLEGGPAENAGLRRGDRIMLIDDKLMTEHERLDWRSDDSYLDDPPVHYLLCEGDGDSIDLRIERKWGEFLDMKVTAKPYSAFEAARASAMVIEDGDYKFAHIHFWMIHITGIFKLLQEKLDGDFADCDALILDLRGRGGNGLGPRQRAA